MRRLVAAIAVATCLTLGLTTVAVAIPQPKLRVNAMTGPIYYYDVSDVGSGPFYPAVVVSGILKNCSFGSYMQSVSLVQDGIAAQWATTALGASEVFCSAHPEKPGIGMYSPTLHPGKATAYISVSGTSLTGVPMFVEDTRTVRIPG